MDLKDTKLVIFDMDGLLLDTERLIVDAWDALAQQKGLDREKIREAVRNKPAEHCFEKRTEVTEHRKMSQIGG